jgi:hypothetical protein
MRSRPARRRCGKQHTRKRPAVHWSAHALGAEVPDLAEILSDGAARSANRQPAPMSNHVTRHEGQRCRPRSDGDSSGAAKERLPAATSLAWWHRRDFSASPVGLLSQWDCYKAVGGSTGVVDQAVQMDPRAVIRMNPAEAQAAAGGQARFSFEVIERQAVAYSVESAVGSWCRLLLPAGNVGRGELVVDVPGDAGPGRYALRLVATASGEEIAAANVMLRIAGERVGGEPCLRVLPRPKFDLQPDGTVVVTLQVVNCGNVDATLVLRARHEDGWSFSVDEPELVIGVQEGPSR